MAEPEEEEAAPRPTPVAIPGDQARGLVEDRGVEKEDVALFLPRAVLFIPSIVLGVVFWPIQKGLRAIERNHVLEHLEDFFYNDERTAAILPTLSIGSGFGLQAGVRAFHEDLFGHREHGEVKAQWGLRGEQTYLISYESERTGGTALWIEAKGVYELHPALRFYGIGDEGNRILGGEDLDPRIGDIETYYEHQRIRGIATLGATFGEPDLELKVGGRGRFKRHDFALSRGFADDEPALQETYDPALVPGYVDGATVIETEGVAIFDARGDRGATNNGFYAEGFAGGALPVRTYEYAHFGVEATGYIELWARDRVLVLRAAMEAVEGNDEKIPFVELPYLGGPNRLRGYPLYRFRDEKVLFGTVEYHYPIHELLAGSLYLDAGEVAPTFGDLVNEPEVHIGGGGGLIFRNKDKVYLTLDVAGGDGVQVYLTTDPLRAFADRDDEL